MIFELGNIYNTLDGLAVRIMDRSCLQGCECVLGSDGIWRYDRSTHSVDAGRVTGSDHQAPHHQNLAWPNYWRTPNIGNYKGPPHE